MTILVSACLLGVPCRYDGQSYDVNETGVVDINDAQLTYDIYSGKYTDFEKVSVRKFLRADVNLDKAVNSTDAVAVVKNSK